MADAAFASAKKTQHHQGSVQFIRRSGLGPGLAARACDGLRIKMADVGGGLWIHEAPLLYRQGAALLGRCVVQERIRPGVEDLLCQGRWAGEIARDNSNDALFDIIQ